MRQNSVSDPGLRRRRAARATARRGPAGRSTERRVPGAGAREKRARIVDAAMRHFAERGFSGARVEEIAAGLSIAKGSIFQHFGTKEGLFLEAYRRAAAMLPAYLDAPAAARAGGFFAVLEHWLGRTGHMLREDWIPYRVTLLGNYGSDLSVRREINRFLVSEDPYGTNAFVRWGIERGEVRDDVPREMVVSLVDWMMGSFQDALLTEELDPGLFRRRMGAPERAAARIEQFMTVLRDAVGAPSARRSAARRER